MRGQVEAMNRRRKVHQTAAGADLAALEAQWQQLVLKNAEIEVRRRERPLPLSPLSTFAKLAASPAP